MRWQLKGNGGPIQVTLAWSAFDETLRLICSFEMEPPEDKIPALYGLLNDVNDRCWAGAFTYWAEQQMMVYRYGLVLAGGHVASPEQIDTMIGALLRARNVTILRCNWWSGETVSEGCVASRHCRGLRARVILSP